MQRDANGKGGWKPAGALPALLAILVGTGPLSARELGPCAGHFSLRNPAPLAKPTAKSPRPLPAPANRMEALVRISSGFLPSSVEYLGWRMLDRQGGIATLEGDAVTYPLLAGVPGILQADRNRTSHAHLDQARKSSRVDEILAWGPTAVSRDRGYSGKGVLVGVVDQDFDTHHPAFLDAGGATRFVGLWDMAAPKAAGSPVGEIRMGKAVSADPFFGNDSNETHGTQVMSIAAGSPASLPYFGPAPEATLIGAKLDYAREGRFIYAIEWMFRVADSLKIPCVINLSYGSHDGPHDGTSTFDQFLDSITGPGRIVVGSAGNDSIHARLDLSPGDTLGTFARPEEFTPTYFKSSLEAWGEKGKPFRYQILVVDTLTGAYLSSEVFQRSDSVSYIWLPEKKIPLKGLDGSGADSLVISLWVDSADLRNQRPDINVTARTSNGRYRVGLRFLGTGALHVWNANSMPLTASGFRGFVSGDASHSIGETGGTAKSIISVGAYTTRTSWKDFSGILHDWEDIIGPMGKLAGFSSRGPTLDGRIKPDICAPGNRIVGAVSGAYQMGIPVDVLEQAYTVLWPNTTEWGGRFKVNYGTSFSAPLVAGVVALMLESQPRLTPRQVKEILQETAYQDSAMGTLILPDNSWGPGKLDAAAAVKKASQIKPPIPVALADDDRLVDPIRARLGGNRLIVTGLAGPSAGGAAVTAELRDLAGRKVAELRQIRGGEFSLPTRLKAGLHVAVVRTPRATLAFRLVLP